MRRAVLLMAAFPVFALAVASAINLPKLLIYNVSESAPIGLYWIDQNPLLRGNYVYVRMPERIKDLATERGYLSPNVPLVKRVVGLNGDRVCRLGERIFLNEVVVAWALRRDRQGRPMPGWLGCHTLSGQTVFLLQDHPQSFDGRYFGPVDRRLIIGRATRLRFP